MSNFNSADIAAFKDVWVFCEQREGKLMPTDFEPVSYTHLDVYKRQVFLLGLVLVLLAVLTVLLLLSLAGIALVLVLSLIHI